MMQGCDPDEWCPWWPMDWHTGPDVGVTLTDGPVSALLSPEDQAHIGDGMPVSRPAGFVGNGKSRTTTKPARRMGRRRRE